MQQILKHVHGLQWRLTLAYALITILMLVSIETSVLAAGDLGGPSESRLTVVHALMHAALVVIVLASIIGTLFGFVTARWLTRRLRLLNSAVDAWSRGDLAVMAEDRANDELGALACRLNCMAQQFQLLLQTQQALVVVEERQRLARDLHDAVKQQVFAISMQLGAARALLVDDPAGSACCLTESERLVAGVQQELGNLIHALRPAMLEDRSLAIALGSVIDDWARRTGIDARTRLDNIIDVSPDVEEALLRLLQESLANIERHSGATSTAVSLQQQSNWVTLTVADNGSGFDPNLVEGRGTGLRGMRERLTALGGELKVESCPNGVTVESRLPFAPGRDSGVLPLRRSQFVVHET